MSRSNGAAKIAHIWATQTMQYKREGNVYFEGDTIYSYGSHFPMARILTNKRGERAAIITIDGYSSTTARHLGETRQAVTHMTCFHVPIKDMDAKGQFESYRVRMNRALLDASKARAKRADYLSEALHYIEEGNAFAAFMGLRARLKTPTDMDKAIADASARFKAERPRAKRVSEQKEREVYAKFQSDLESWKRGGDINLPYRSGPAYLRIVGDQIETSRNASVPLAVAIRAYRHFKPLRESGMAWTRDHNPDNDAARLSHYTIDRMDDDGTLHIGCHTITWNEVESVIGRYA